MVKAIWQKAASPPHMHAILYTLQWAAPSLIKIVPSHGGSGPPSNTWFLGPTRVHNPNSISMASAVFVGLTIVMDRLTDHTTLSVTIIVHVYVHSTAMRPKIMVTCDKGLNQLGHQQSHSVSCQRTISSVHTPMISKLLQSNLTEKLKYT